VGYIFSVYRANPAQWARTRKWRMLAVISGIFWKMKIGISQLFFFSYIILIWDFLG